jgi:hypothetical protein
MSTSSHVLVIEMDMHVIKNVTCMHCHMHVKEAFQRLLTPEQQKLQLAKRRKMLQKMQTMAAENANPVANPGATAGVADQPSGYDEGMPSLSSPLQDVDGADVPSPAAEDFLGRRARVGAENNKMFPTDGMFRRVRRHFGSLLSCTSDVYLYISLSLSCCASPPTCIWA